jgi:hypothetical protein
MEWVPASFARKLERDLTAANARADAAEAKYADIQKIVNDHTADENEFAVEYEKAITENESLRAEIARLTAELEQARRERGDAQAAGDILARELSKLRAQLDTAMDLLSNLLVPGFIDRGGDIAALCRAARTFLVTLQPRPEREPRPPVVCLCGSTRFSDAFRAANLRETLAGKIVLSIGCDFKSDDALGLTEEDKTRLDELHLRKIDLADEVLILNVGGYVGESTRREIEYANKTGKPIFYLEPQRPEREGGA